VDVSACRWTAARWRRWSLLLTTDYGLLTTDSPSAQKNIRALLRRPGNQAYLRVPSIPSVAWQPYPSPLGRLRAHSFAPPPHDGFAASRMSVAAWVAAREHSYLERFCRGCKLCGRFFRKMLQINASRLQPSTPSGGRTKKRRGKCRGVPSSEFTSYLEKLSSFSHAAGIGRHTLSSAKCHECSPFSPGRHEK